MNSKSKLPDFGLLLPENSYCPLSTKIHYAQMIGAKLLLVGYSSNELDEVQVDVSSFLGVRIPVIFLKHSDVEYLLDVANSVSENHIALKIIHEKDQIASNDEDKLLLFMSSQPYSNPVINFLIELETYHHLLSKREVEVVFSIGYCLRCKSEGYLKHERRCLGGGKYCTVNSGFKTNALVKETIRMICIRNHFQIEKLVKYMKYLKKMFEGEVKDFTNLQTSEEFQLKDMSYRAMNMAQIRDNIVEQCYKDSFFKRDNQHGLVTVDNIDEDMDENVLLQKEQERYLFIIEYFLLETYLYTNLKIYGDNKV